MVMTHGLGWLVSGLGLCIYFWWEFHVLSKCLGTRLLGIGNWGLGIRCFTRLGHGRVKRF